MIVQRILPPPAHPQHPTQTLSPKDADSITSLSQTTVIPIPAASPEFLSDTHDVPLGQVSFPDLFDTGFFSVHHKRQPIVF